MEDHRRLVLSPERGTALVESPAAHSFLLSSPRLESEGVHVVSVIHTNSLPLERCPGDPAVISAMCLDKRELMFAHGASVTAPFRYSTNQSFNVIEK